MHKEKDMSEIDLQRTMKKTVHSALNIVAIYVLNYLCCSRKMRYVMFSLIHTIQRQAQVLFWLSFCFQAVLVIFLSFGSVKLTVKRG